MGFFSKMGIKQKITVMTSASMIVLMLVIVFVLNFIIVAHEENKFADDTKLQSEQIDYSVRLFLNSLKDAVALLADNPGLTAGGNITVYSKDMPADANGMIEMDPVSKGGYEATAYDIFRRFGEKYKNTVSVVSLGTTDGGYLQYPVVKRKAGYDATSRDWYKETMSSSDKIRSTEPFMTSKGVPTIGIFTVLRDNGNQPIGVLGINVDLPVLTDVIGDIQIGDTGYVILTDKKGMVIADPQNTDVNFKNLGETGVEGLDKLAGITDGLCDITLDGVDKTAYVYSSEKSDYRYITIVDRSQLMAGVNKIRIALVVILVAALALIVVLSRVVANSVAAPLEILGEAANAIASGDLRERNMDIDSDDEIGMLAQKFEDMRGRLTGLLREIKNSSSDVLSASDELSNGANQCSEAVTHVAETVSDIAESAQHQSDTIKESVTSLTAINDRVKDIADGADVISESSGKAGSAAENGRAAILNAVNQMEKISASVEESAKAVAVLGERSQEVGEIVNTISDIAQQTNLLALNAAIEAARAGEHGRGFAVVAEEVRKLAEESGKAAEEIGKIIGIVQSDTTLAVNKMKTGTEDVRAGSRIVDEAGAQFKLIGEHITKVDELAKKSAEAANLVAADSQKALEGTIDIEHAEEKVTANIDSISAATEEQSASMQQVAASSQNLAKMAEHLQKEAAKFRF